MVGGSSREYLLNKEFIDIDICSKGTPEMNLLALSNYELISKEFNCDYDEAGSIGKRYRRADAIGTPYCITVDFDTANDNAVTIRNRDTMQQERVAISDLVNYLREKVKI